MNHYQKAVEVPTITPAREERGYLHTARAGVAVPFSQSVITAFIVTAVFAALFFAFGWRRMEKVTLLIFVIALAFDWYVHRRHWFGLTKPDQPQVQIRSVDHDENPSTPKIVRVQIDKVTENGHVQQTKMFNLPATEEQLSILAAGLLDFAKPFSEAEWCGAGKPFSLNEFRALRGEMIRRNLLGLRNGKDARQGYTLTEDGQAVMEQFLPPSPTDEEA